MEPMGRLVEFELSEDEELLLRYVCRVVVENSDPVSIDVFLLCSSFLRASSGSPSHLLFTLGTCSGSFCTETLDRPTAVARPVFPAAAFFCCSANCSSADVEGSFRVRKPKTPFFFLLLFCCCACGCLPCDVLLRGVPVSMFLGLGLERCEASLVPLPRSDAVRVLDCDEDGCSEALLLPLLVAVLFRTASLGTRTVAAALVSVDIIGSAPVSRTSH